MLVCEIDVSITLKMEKYDRKKRKYILQRIEKPCT
jgi:hypothetical protein